MTRHCSVRCIACVVFVLVSLALVGCGASPEGGVEDGAWPMQVELPGVLGYGALPVRVGELGRLFSDGAAIDIDGLADDGRLLMIQLDETTHGGIFSLAVPIASRDLVLASIEASDGAIERLDKDRVTVTLAPHSGFATLATFARMASSSQSGLGAIEAMLTSSAPISFTTSLEVTDDHLILAPSFEGMAVTRAMLDRLTAMSTSSGLDDVVLVIDLERNALAYHAPIQEMRTSVRMLFSAAPAAGFGAMMNQLKNDDNPLAAFPRISSDILDALFKMFEAVDATAIRIEAKRGPGSMSDFTDFGDFSGDEADELGRFVSSPLRATVLVPDEGTMLAAMRPAPRVPEAQWTFGADSEAWADAASRWCRPLAVTKHGEGSAADQAVGALRDLLAGWDGTAAMINEEQPYMLFTTNPASGFDVPALVRWFEPIAQRVGSDEKPTLTPAGEGFWYFINADSSVAATVGTIGNDVLWLTAGDGDGPSMDAVDAILRAPRADDGPFQRFAETVEDSEVALEFSREPGVLTFDAIWSP